MNENIYPQPQKIEKMSENEAKEKFEGIFSIYKEKYSDVGIIEGSKYNDYLGAMKNLSFLESDLEKLDIINYTAHNAMESSVEYKRNSKYEVHRFFLDRSARILGVFLHDVLSKMNEEKHDLLNNEIFFINPNNVLNGHSDEKEKKIAEILLKTRSGKKILNIIVDEYIASGKGSRKVREYFDMLCDKYKTGEVNDTHNDIEGFYSADNCLDANVYRPKGATPSWFNNEKISGLIEKGMDNDQIIIPATDKEIKKSVEEIRESLSRASTFVASIVRDGLLNSSFLENGSVHSTIMFEEKKILLNKILEFLNCILLPSGVDLGLNKINEIEKIAEDTKNNKLLKKIPEIKIALNEMRELKCTFNKQYTDFVVLIRDEMISFI